MGQSVLATHSTQRLVVVLQAGFAASLQSVLTKHSTQEVLFLHNGLAASPQSGSSKHSTQAAVTPLQCGVAPRQAGLLPHLQAPAAHWFAVVVEHCVLQFPQYEKFVFRSTHWGAIDTKQHAGCIAPAKAQDSSLLPLQLLSLPSQISAVGPTAPFPQTRKRCAAGTPGTPAN
jgi:hypothetical protein